jgi:hypothetical protein
MEPFDDKHGMFRGMFEEEGKCGEDMVHAVEQTMRDLEGRPR